MAYERQIQEHLDRFDVSLNKLYTLIKRGQQNEALEFMKEGELKERFEELQSIIKVSNVRPLGASGITGTGTL